MTVKRKDFLVPPPPQTRLSEPSFDATARDVYGRVLDALRDAHVEFLVGGALAVNRYTGIWRDTKDLDLYVRPENVDATLAVLAKAGFETERVYQSWLSKAWESDAFVDIIHRNASGVHPPDDAWFERAPEGEVVGRRVAFVPPEELVFAKSFVGNRYRYDGADVLHIVYATKGALDWDVLLRRAGRDYAGLLLAHLHLYRWTYPKAAGFVPDTVLDRLAARAGEDLEKPSIGFRGRLLDLNAFEVDVIGWNLPDAHAARMREILGPGVKDGGGPS